MVIALPCLIWYLRNRNTWIESTSDGLRSSSGKELKLKQITKFDKKKWAKKGIGVIHFVNDQGAEDTFVVDDLKFNRQTVDEMVRWVESNIKPEMIVNGAAEVQEKDSSDVSEDEAGSDSEADSKDEADSDNEDT